MDLPRARWMTLLAVIGVGATYTFADFDVSAALESIAMKIALIPPLVLAIARAVDEMLNVEVKAGGSVEERDIKQLQSFWQRVW